MRSAWICVLSLAWSACAAGAPVSGDVDETALGLGSGDERERDDDSPPSAAKPVVTCFDARHGISVSVEARRPGAPGEPALPQPDGPGGPDDPRDESCDPEAGPRGEGRRGAVPVPGAPGAPHAPVLVIVEREAGAVACGCGIGFVESARGVPAVPADAPAPGVPATRAVPAIGAEQHSHAHTAGAPGMPAITVAVSGGAPGAPARIVAPPSCEELTEQCYADGRDAELCEALAECCANTPVPAAAPAPT